MSFETDILWKDGFHKLALTDFLTFFLAVLVT